MKPEDSATYSFRLLLSLHSSQKAIKGTFSSLHLNHLLTRQEARKAFLAPIKNRIETFIAEQFYEQNYEVVFSSSFAAAERKTKTEFSPNTCRFCKKGRPAVTFIKKAHAVPESAGNKAIFCSSECDQCNERFGNTIENHFGKWSAAHRTLAHVAGKKGVPQMGRTKGTWNIRAIEDVTHIKVTNEFDMFREDKLNGKINLVFPVENFIPLAVYKTFCKIALSLANADDLKFYQPVLDWILNPDHAAGLPGARPRLIETFFAGNAPMSPGGVVLLRRKTDNVDKPYLTLIVCFGLFTYQIAVPNGPHEHESPFKLPPYSTTFDRFEGHEQDIRECYLDSVTDLTKSPAKRRPSESMTRTNVTL